MLQRLILSAVLLVAGGLLGFDTWRAFKNQEYQRNSLFAIFGPVRRTEYPVIYWGHIVFFTAASVIGLVLAVAMLLV